MRRVGRFLFVLACLAALVVLALWATQPLLEQRAAEHIARAGAAAGVTIGDVRFAWNGPVRLRNVIVDRRDTGRVQIEQADISWDLAGGRDPRAHVRRFDLRGIRMQRGPLTMELSETAFEVISWDVTNGRERLRLRQIPSGGEFETTWPAHAATSDIGLVLKDVDLASARVRWSGEDVLQPGTWTGRLGLSSAGDDVTLRGDAGAQGVRVKLPPALGDGGFGAPVAVKLAWDAVRGPRSVDVRRFDADVGGLVVAARGRVDGLGPEAVIDA